MRGAGWSEGSRRQDGECWKVSGVEDAGGGRRDMRGAKAVWTPPSPFGLQEGWDSQS